MIYSRVTNTSLNQAVLQSLFNNRGKLNELQQQISTNKKVDTPSDDASAAIGIMNSNSSLDKIDIYNNNIENSISELNVTDNQLGNVVDLVQRAKELTVQAANASSGTTELNNINSEIEQIMENIKSIGNTKFGSNYIFAGVNTNQEPFTTPATGEVDYIGTLSTGDYQRNVEISDGITVTVNTTGDEVFGYYRSNATPPPTYEGTGLFNTLQTLSNELKTDPPNYDNIRSKIDDLDTDLNNVLNIRAKIGGLTNRLEMTQSRMEDDRINITGYKSGLEDIDMAKAISDMQFQETALEASLQVSSKLMSISLMNYL